MINPSPALLMQGPLIYETNKPMRCMPKCVRVKVRVSLRDLKVS